jgi:hypothetical protein
VLEEAVCATASLACLSCSPLSRSYASAPEEPLSSKDRDARQVGGRVSRSPSWRHEIGMPRAFQNAVSAMMRTPYGRAFLACRSSDDTGDHLERPGSVLRVSTSLAHQYGAIAAAVHEVTDPTGGGGST